MLAGAVHLEQCQLEVEVLDTLDKLVSQCRSIASLKRVTLIVSFLTDLLQHRET